MSMVTLGFFPVDNEVLVQGHCFVSVTDNSRVKTEIAHGESL